MLDRSKKRGREKGKRKKRNVNFPDVFSLLCFGFFLGQYSEQWEKGELALAAV